MLGNKSGCLSFNQKVNLLIEIGALSKNSRNKFQAFMEIRNQFMHNLEASNYEECFSFIKDTGNFLLKNYPQSNNLNREEQLKVASQELGNDVAKMTASLTEKVLEKFNKDIEGDLVENSNEAFSESIVQLRKNLMTTSTKKLKKVTFNTQRLKGFGTELSEIIFSLWKSNFDKLNAIK